MKIFKLLIISTLLLSLNSCSRRFEITSDISHELANISLNISEESIPVYEFTTRLKHILNSKEDINNKYRLDINFNKNTSSLIIQRDADSIRESIELIINYKLYNKATSELLYSGKIRQINSYNSMFSPFSTNIEAFQADKNLYRTSAEELRRKLILYFKRTASSK